MQKIHTHRIGQRLTLAVSAGLLALASVSVHAELPPERHADGITYRVGGIGATEAGAMRGARGQYSLSLTFTERAADGREMFSGGVRVRIVNAEDVTLLDTEAPGPMLLANLPDGTYTVEATLGAESKSQTITVASGSPRHLVLSWPQQVVTPAPPSLE